MVKRTNRYRRRVLAGALSLFVIGLPATWAQEPEPQPWQTPYTGEAVTGRQVLAAWLFRPGAEGKDASGRGRDLTLRGQSAFIKDGPWGGCLETFGPADERTANKPNGALVGASTNLTPSGAFTIEMWIKPKPEFEEDPKGAWLFDKMYVNHKHEDPNVEYWRDYALRMTPPVKGKRKLLAHLGFGDSMLTYTSQPMRVAAQAWHHIAFAYDGAGEGRFFWDGTAIGGGREPGRKGVAPGSRPAVIGDRVGASYGEASFPGFIAQVRLCSGALAFYSGKIDLSAAGRSAFIRMEKKGRLDLELYNNRSESLAKATLVVDIAGAAPQRIPVPAMEAGQKQALSCDLDTRLRPGRYTIRGTLEGHDGRICTLEAPAPLTIVARPLPFRMPVVMWGWVDLSNQAQFALLKRIGFTHSVCGPTLTESLIWENGKSFDAAPDIDVVKDCRRQLDDALANDHAMAAWIRSEISWRGKLKAEFQRVDRGGKPYTTSGFDRNPCGLRTGTVESCYKVGALVAQTYGNYPGLQAAGVHSEVTDTAQVCFHEHDRAAFRAYAGFDIPEAVMDKRGLSYREIRDFPADRIIPDDHPLLVYYRWFWKEGHGWNPIHSAVHRGLKSTGRTDLWTWYDPAVRTPSLFGSGGAVDVISQWTYSYPDPIRIALATDELFAMAEGAKAPQKVMKMTQVIWYRSQTAPKPKPGEEGTDPHAAWKKTMPEAEFITIAPDHLREAFWSKLARPVQGIMYHGWESLVDCGKTGYCFTHLETQEALAQLVRSVVQPLGPTLLQVPDRESDVGYLESFASQMFAGKGSWGWCRDDMYLVMQYAQLQPRILYEETILKKGLDGLRVLVMTDCDVLPRSVADKIMAFQRKGGLIVADECLCPALVPDIRLSQYKRTGKPDVDKAALQAKAAELRQMLDPFYRRPSDSSNMDVITRVRSRGSADYLFAVNDRRTFGDYVGQWGLVMEKGLPTDATLTLDRPGGHVYDLLAGRSVPAVTEGGRLRIECLLGPGGGAVLMVTDRAIAGVTLEAPRRVRLGRTARIRIAVVDEKGHPVDAVVPVQVDLHDAAGKPAEFSGHYGAKDGRVDITLDLAPNDRPGTWKIRVRELASGRTSESLFCVLK